jgi:hypothetical protein
MLISHSRRSAHPWFHFLQPTQAFRVCPLIETRKPNSADPRPGLPMALRTFPIIPQSGSTNCCPGIGSQPRANQSRCCLSCLLQVYSIMPLHLPHAHLSSTGLKKKIFWKPCRVIGCMQAVIFVETLVWSALVRPLSKATPSCPPTA